jgi:hypothetical protein
MRTGLGPPWGFHIAPDETAREPDAGPEVPPLAREILALDPTPVQFYETGFSDLDSLVGGGVATRSVTSVVATTGAGKSGFVLSLADHVSRRYSIPALYVSTELDDDEVAERIAAIELGESHARIARGLVPREVLRDATRDCRIRVLSCQLFGPQNQNPLATIESAALAVTEADGDPPLVIVDYLQMLAIGSGDQTRTRVTELAYGLRSMASRLGLAVVAVCSAARGVNKRRDVDLDDPRTYLETAKESGDVEYASANVVYLEPPDADSADGACRIFVAKARRGSAGVIGSVFDGKSGRWSQARESVSSRSGEARASQRHARSEAAAETKVLELVRAHGARLSWRSMRELGGLSVKSLDRARARLLVTNRIETISVNKKDAMGRNRSFEGLRVCFSNESYN